MDRLQTEEKIKAILSGKLNIPVEKINSGSSLRDDLGMDSFGSIETVFEIEDAFNISVPQEGVSDVLTFQDMVDLVVKLSTAQKC